MKILVTGATGVIGQRAVPGMLERGHEVTAVGRSARRLNALRAAGARTRTLDLDDRGAVFQAVRGHDAVVNLVTHVPTGLRQFLPGAWAETNRLRRVVSATLVDAALAAGSSRFIQESFAPIYEDGEDRWLDEDAPVRPGRYNRSVVDAEASADRFTRAGGFGMVARFALLYGAEDGFTEQLLRAARRGWFPFFGRPEGYVSFVHQVDAATAVVALLDAPPGIFNVVDDTPPTRALLAGLLGRLQNVRPPRPLPRWLQGLGGSLAETVARSLRISNRKLREETGWTPRFRSVEEGLEDALGPSADRHHRLARLSPIAPR